MKSEDFESKHLEILQDMFIFTLLKAGLPQRTVRKIVKVDLGRVARIGKLLKKARVQEGEAK
jgi:hypothetical protein